MKRRQIRKTSKAAVRQGFSSLNNFGTHGCEFPTRVGFADDKELSFLADKPGAPWTLDRNRRERNFLFFVLPPSASEASRRHTRRQAWTRAVPDATTLRSFLNLADAKPLEIRDFARRYGALQAVVDEHGHSIPVPLEEVADGYQLAAEPLLVWRTFASGLRMVIDTADKLVHKIPVPSNVWSNLCWTKITEFSLSDPHMRAAIAEYEAKTRTAPEKGRDPLDATLDFLTALRHQLGLPAHPQPEPAERWRALQEGVAGILGNPINLKIPFSLKEGQVSFGAPLLTLKDHLVMEALFELGRGRLAFCANPDCNAVFTQRRIAGPPKKYCPRCGDVYARRAASRRWYHSPEHQKKLQKERHPEEVEV